MAGKFYSWQHVFNANLGWWGHITVAAQAAHNAGYPYMLWNGRVYKVVASEKIVHFEQMGTGGFDADGSIRNPHTVEDIG